MAAHQFRRAGDPEEYPGQRAAIRASLEPQPPAPVDYARSWWEKEEQAYRARRGDDGQGCSRYGYRSNIAYKDTEIIQRGSPLLIDSVIEKASVDGLLVNLPARGLRHRTSMYADDVVIFLKPERLDIFTFAVIGEASGQRTNLAKCSVHPIRCSPEVSVDGLLVNLPARGLRHRTSMYADDVVIFLKPERLDIFTFTAIGEACGQRTNLAKCSVHPIRCSPEQLELARNILQCEVVA
ncbi:hypothetical protein ACQ4PT_027347 [Festuca glaucescens]